MNAAYEVSTLTSQLDPEAGQQPVGSIFFKMSCEFTKRQCQLRICDNRLC
jgi:hypothetical protein